MSRTRARPLVIIDRDSKDGFLQMVAPKTSTVRIAYVNPTTGKKVTHRIEVPPSGKEVTVQGRMLGRVSPQDANTAARLSALRKGVANLMMEKSHASSKKSKRTVVPATNAPAAAPSRLAKVTRKSVSKSNSGKRGSR
jgi:hypothetical protein